MTTVIFTLSMAASVAGILPLEGTKADPAQLPGIASRYEGAREMVYKRPGGDDAEKTLSLHVFLPNDWAPDDERGAILYFHGGGWRGGDPAQFVPFCQAAVAEGMVAITAEYRLTKPGRNAVTCMEDARDAFLWLRAQAPELGIDPERIAAGGGSAGGQLALSLVFEPPAGIDPSTPRPAALVLMNPVLRLERFKGAFGGTAAAESASPINSLAKNPPPMIIFLGTEDHLVSATLAETFQDRVEQLGSRCDLRLFEGERHGFFNRDRGERRFSEVNEAALRFLRELDLASPRPEPR